MIYIPKEKLYLPVGLVLLIALTTGGLTWFFLKRKPVLFVTDSSFALVYGPGRLQNDTIGMSMALFRRVIPVIINASAGPDLVAIAVEGASDNPLAVFFPYRYIDGARFYREKNPSAPILMVGGSRSRRDASFTFVRADTALDLYRAGACAQILAMGKKVLFYGDGTLEPEYEEAFRSGITASGGEEEPVFTSIPVSPIADYGCVVLAGPASRFLEENQEIPVILFSWADPALTPLYVKAGFDDSILALVPKALKSLPAVSEEILFPSSTTVFKDRIKPGSSLRKVNSFIKAKPKALQ